MKTITISYSYRKHPDDDYEQQIISAFQALGFEYDGCDTAMDINMTRGLFFIVPANKQDIDIEVNTFDDDQNGFISDIVDSEQRRRAEMDEYFKIIEKRVLPFNRADSNSKIEIMREILQSAQSFIDYYTDD